MKEYLCGHCHCVGPKQSNGFSHGWCGNCGMNNKLTEYTPEHPTYNGNAHVANMEVHEYGGLAFIMESPQPGAVRLTVYRGEETTPISKEVYDNGIS